MVHAGPLWKVYLPGGASDVQRLVHGDVTAGLCGAGELGGCRARVINS
jgi:hypothetical protein